MSDEIIQNYLSDAIESFRNYQKLAEKAMVQVSDDEFFRAIDPESNSIALIVKHIAGNQHSRWRDFLTTDGEKPDRDRDSEFELIDEDRKALMKFWESGWQTLFGAIGPLVIADFGKSVTIRGQKHTLCEALNRQLTHYAYHIGQIVLLAKDFRTTDWQTLSVPKNKSNQFNAFVAENGDEKRKQIDVAADFHAARK